jgi:WD40 repeat protein
VPYFVVSVKGITFFGPKSEYIVSGSDCGNIYFWDKGTESIVQWMLGDENGVVRMTSMCDDCVSVNSPVDLNTVDTLWWVRASVSHLGGVVVSVLATGPKGCGFKTRPRRWIFKGDKNPQHSFLSDGK